MNKKQIVVTFILAILIVSLLFVQNLFDKKFRDITILNNNMGKLQEYYIQDGKYSYLLPESWDVEDKVSNESNIYNVEFKDSTNNIIGNIQILNSTQDINTMAETDIENMVLERSKEEIETLKFGDKKGIKVKYKTKVNNGYKYINSSYYMSMDDNEKVKMTFIVREDNYNDDMTSVFDTIVRSIDK